MNVKTVDEIMELIVTSWNNCDKVDKSDLFSIYKGYDLTGNNLVYAYLASVLDYWNEHADNFDLHSRLPLYLEKKEYTF